MGLRPFTGRESNNREAVRELSHETACAFCSLTQEVCIIGKIFGRRPFHGLMCFGVPGGKSKDVEA